MKKIMFLLILLVFIFSGCQYESDADKEQREATDDLVSEAHRQVGMPNMVNFQEKKMMKMIYELRDKANIICYAYFYNEYTAKIGDPVGPPGSDGKCIGYGLPFSAQFSNPEKIIKRRDSTLYAGSSPATIPQPEPNGLFMPTSSSATWLMLINPETNKPEAVYIEPLIIVSPFKLK